jgi:hypothetical protein
MTANSNPVDLCLYHRVHYRLIQAVFYIINFIIIHLAAKLVSVNFTVPRDTVAKMSGSSPQIVNYFVWMSRRALVARGDHHIDKGLCAPFVFYLVKVAQISF